MPGEVPVCAMNWSDLLLPDYKMYEHGVFLGHRKKHANNLHFFFFFPSLTETPEVTRSLYATQTKKTACNKLGVQKCQFPGAGNRM